MNKLHANTISFYIGAWEYTDSSIHRGPKSLMNIEGWLCLFLLSYSELGKIRSYAIAIFDFQDLT